MRRPLIAFCTAVAILGSGGALALGGDVVETYQVKNDATLSPPPAP